MGASVDLPGGKKDFVKMGSYGIGVSRLVGAIIEAKYDDQKEIMKWPLSVAPYDIALIPMVSKNDTSALEKANNINNELIKHKIDAIIDDTDEKFNQNEFEKKVSDSNRLITKGIEVGHIFYFGDKYSKPMGASVDLPGGKKDFVKMGSYGIGVSRLVGAIIAVSYTHLTLPTIYSV